MRGAGQQQTERRKAGEGLRLAAIGEAFCADEIFRHRANEQGEDERQQIQIDRRETEKILRKQFDNFPIHAAEDFAKLQIRRLESAVGKLSSSPEAREIGATAVLLKVFDRLDRYHGFGNGASAPMAPSEEVKRRIMDKLNKIAARALTQGSQEL